jgi:hypothetical protein
MRRIATALFVALILGEVVVSPFICLQCCPSQGQSEGDHDPEACPPWCVACSCCHLTHSVRPEMPQPAVVQQTTPVYLVDSVTPLLFTPPREVLHVPLTTLHVA